MEIINFIAMIASVVSAYMAVRARNEAQRILVQVREINSPVTNNGNNSGIMSHNILGGVSIDGKQ